MQNPHKGHRGRLRARAEADGLAHFSQHEVVELLLMCVIPRRDVNPLAHALVERYGSIRALLFAPANELLRFPGVGEKTVALFSALNRIAGAVERDCAVEKIQLSNPRESREFLRAFFQLHAPGALWQFNLDVNGRLICAQAICEVQAEVGEYVRAISQSALECGAKTVLFAFRVERATSWLRERLKTEMPRLREQLDRIDVRLAECYALVGEDVYNCFVSGMAVRWRCPRGAQFAAELRERPARFGRDTGRKNGERKGEETHAVSGREGENH